MQIREKENAGMPKNRQEIGSNEEKRVDHDRKSRCEIKELRINYSFLFTVLFKFKFGLE